ncbi:uncharacterized protein ARMOST_18316 [Armillaria ostoyae]|uniref:Uncharacterized protein n=1 Tax=Armillaria ostoyae TaxID=47428 RepID=A0A284S1H4_ARMOS|nr:uncharacterized protein ARMOST_18316 [Armillaria ostoyae]
MFSKFSISRHHITLEAAGLVALADLSIVTVRTALTGTASLLDVLLLAPGSHYLRLFRPQDSWGFWVLGMLIVARTINVIIARRRSKDSEEWKGAPEDGDGDLLILLSQDRWVRLQGSLHDIKTVTAGEWLRDRSTVESFFVALATLLVYITAALAGNGRRWGACLSLASCSALPPF